jgi:hypothetical protein
MILDPSNLGVEALPRIVGPHLRKRLGAQLDLPPARSSGVKSPPERRP